MAFLNADWHDFESTPAAEEKLNRSIAIFDYHRLLSKTGLKITHRANMDVRPTQLTDMCHIKVS